MANDQNQCNFTGRLGADVETRYMADSSPVCNFRIAVGWKSKDKEGAEWVRIVTFGKLAEICNEYLRKGSRVRITGRYRERKWQDQSGQDKYTTEIVANEMQMLDSRAQSGSEQAARTAPAQERALAQEQSKGFADFDDDIPGF